jgi:type IV pilus biogenesis protein CpaD/CtpE
MGPTAGKCVRLRFPFGELTMKKLFALMVVFAALVAGCAEKNDTTPADPAPPATQEPADETPADEPAAP